MGNNEKVNPARMTCHKLMGNCAHLDDLLTLSKHNGSFADYEELLSLLKETYEVTVDERGEHKIRWGEFHASAYMGWTDEEQECSE